MKRYNNGESFYYSMVVFYMHKLLRHGTGVIQLSKYMKTILMSHISLHL